MSIPMCSHAPKTMLHLRKALRLVPSSSPASSSPILDFLLPPSASSLFASATPRRGYATSASTTMAVEVQPRARQIKSLASRRQHAIPLSAHSVSSWTSTTISQPRTFSTTSRRCQTQTLLNPQKDDDGNEMRLEITSRAAKRLAKVMEKDGNNRLALRIQVESGGCHGFQYLMSLVTLPDQLPSESTAAETGADGELVIREDDTIFTFNESDTPRADPLDAPKIILDTPSLELLNGSKVDFTMELIGSQFKIVDNPAASSSCGCGTSFDIKV